MITEGYGKTGKDAPVPDVPADDFAAVFSAWASKRPGKSTTAPHAIDNSLKKLLRSIVFSSLSIIR
jgi:hypothetical protein